MGILLYLNMPHSVTKFVYSLESFWSGIMWKPCHASLSLPVQSFDEQTEDDRLAVVELGLADQVGVGEPHVALPGLGLEVGEEAMDGLARLLPDSVDFCGLRLHGLLGHAAGDDVLEVPRFCEVLDLGPRLL